MTSRDITFSSHGHTLAGTLAIPDGLGRHPAALLITGSGPLDRDTNMKRQQLNVMRHIADHLREAGIATLRYDKRGIGASEGDYHSTGFHDNVADAAAAVEALRAEIDPAGTFVVGHSEGALIATRLAATGVAMDGAVLLAGSARSGKDILLHQAAIANDTLPGFVRFVMKLMRTDVHKLQAKRLAQLEATTGDSTRIQFVKINAKWFREFMVYNPADDFPSIEVPLLAITGEKDLQVPAADVEVMESLAGGSIATHRPADLTHILRNDPGEPSLEAYRTLLQLPTDAHTMGVVADWITTVAAQRIDQPSR